MGRLIKRLGNLCSDWILLQICRSRARFMCTGAGKAWFEEEDIFNLMDGYKLRDLGSDSHSHVLVKAKAMESLLIVLETRKGYDGTKEVKCPDALAEKHKSISCLVREWINKHILYLVALIPTMVALIRIIWRIHQRRKLSTRAEQLYIQVCEVLEEAALTAKDTGTEGESWVVASRLRDHLLSPKERKNSALWKKVEALVQEDSRLEQYQKLIKGEPKIVWEWQVEGSLRSSKVMSKSSMMNSGEQILESSQKVRRKLQLCEPDS
ncbi:unnamed protein product [Victoria cruziana]